MEKAAEVDASQSLRDAKDCSGPTTSSSAVRAKLGDTNRTWADLFDYHKKLGEFMWQMKGIEMQLEELERRGDDPGDIATELTKTEVCGLDWSGM